MGEEDTRSLPGAAQAALRKRAVRAVRQRQPEVLIRFFDDPTTRYAAASVNHTICLPR